jgi:hypothetical protein|tara:strand:+ start:3455 stop:4432 length:978 start_codon:yes stop_codon:yes gene_type:complete
MDEKYIQIFCDKKKYQLIKIIDFNKRKDTATLHAKIPNTNKNILIKIFGSNAPPKVISSFKSEIEFYKNNSSLQCISNFINSEQNFFVIELFNGDTLPKIINSYFFIRNEDDLSNIFSQIKLIFNEFYNFEVETTVINKNTKKFVVESLIDRLGNLITSGPKGSERSNFEAFILRQFYKKNLKNLEKKLNIIIESWIKKNYKIHTSYGHNDLHCNNFLSNTNFSDSKIIDFENLTYPGIWISDLLYFYGTLFALLSSKKHLQNEIQNQACEHICSYEPRFNPNEIYKIVKLFCISAESNSRFRLYNKGIKMNKILQFNSTVKDLI